LALTQNRRLLREMRLRAPEKYFSQFGGDGEVRVEADRVAWLPPRHGGSISWTVALNRHKNGERYDAYMTGDWALFRASDIIPAAITRTVKGATGKTTLSFSLPANWSSVTQYYGRNQRYRVKNPQRRFARPTGWILLGKIGVRAEKMAGIKVKIAAPVHQDAHRMDMLALLAWTLPEVNRLFAGFPSRLTIFSAGDPMWHGGLSAPSSLFLHSSLPLLSENSTSTLLHEVVHVGMGASAASGADWIIEGMAEYYALQILLRSGTISQHRFDRALAGLDLWGGEAGSLCSDDASGPVTAKAAVLMHAINMELEKQTDGQHNLDDVMHVLAASQHKITIEDFSIAVTGLLQHESEAMNNANIVCAP